MLTTKHTVMFFGFLAFLTLCTGSSAAQSWPFREQTGTALHETGDNFAFGVLPNGDVVAIKKSGTGTNSTEVHILDAGAGYKRFREQTGTALHETGDNFAFGVLPNGDVVAIKKSGTGTNSTEVHILDAGAGYKRFREQTGTALHETGDNFAFGVLPSGDVVAIKKSGTGTSSTEVHILDAGAGYKRFREQTGTALHETGDNFAFAVFPNGDVAAIKKSQTGTKSTEIHILDAAAGYKRFKIQSGTALHETGNNFAFGVLPGGDLVAIKKSQTGTNSTEIHILVQTIPSRPADCPRTACIGFLEVCCGSGTVIGPCLGIIACDSPPRQ